MAMAANGGFKHWRDIDWRQPSVMALVLANLVPIFGVIFLHWEVFPLMFLFWSENVIVGGFNVLKMLCANPDSPLSWIGKVFTVPFFCFHYGMFTFIHGIFVIGLFGQSALGPMRGFPNLGTYWRVMRENHLGWAVVGLAVSHGISFATNYIGKGEYRRVRMDQFMSQPYGRIIVMQFALIFGGFVMMALHSPVAGLVLLVVLKMALDLNAHTGERKKFAEAPAGLLPGAAAIGQAAVAVTPDRENGGGTT